MRVVSITVLALLVTAAACASGGGAGGGSRYLLDNDELSNLSEHTSVYEAIERLRPQWLRPVRTLGGHRSVAEAWLDERRLGDLEELRNFEVSSVTEIRFIPVRESVNRYGTDAGVIMAYTRAPD